MTKIVPTESGSAWIEDLTDDECLEVYWLYLEEPEAFFKKYPKPLLGQALRYALRALIQGEKSPPSPS